MGEIIKKSKKRAIRVVLPEGLVEQMERLVKEDRFTSRAEITRFGVRLAIMFEKGKLHQRAEDYGYQDIIAGIKRGMSVSGH